MSAIHFFTGGMQVGSGVVSTGGYFDPRSFGAIQSVTFSEDRVSPAGLAVGENIIIEQAGKFYAPSLSNGVFNNTSWMHVARTITAAEVAPTGVDFSANGKPIRFGFLRGSSERFPQVHEHGIDNFRVVVRLGPPSGAPP